MNNTTNNPVAILREAVEISQKALEGLGVSGMTRQFAMSNNAKALVATSRAATQPAGDAVTIYVFEQEDCDPVIEECGLLPGRHTLYTSPPAPVQAAPDAVMDDSDKEKLLWCLRTVRAMADEGRALLGNWYPDAVTVCGTLKRVLGDTTEAMEAGAPAVQAAPVGTRIPPVCKPSDAPSDAEVDPQSYAEGFNRCREAMMCTPTAPERTSEAGELPPLPATPPDSLSSDYPKEERAAFDKWHMRYGQGFRQWSVYSSAELVAAWAAWYARARQSPSTVTGSVGDDALLAECKRFLEDMHMMKIGWTIAESQKLHAKLAARSPVASAPKCVCGVPMTLGTVHRTDGPCYTPDAAPESAEPSADRESLEAAEQALAFCYNVNEWPGDGTSIQDEALTKVRAALATSSAAKGAA